MLIKENNYFDVSVNIDYISMVRIGRATIDGLIKTSMKILRKIE